MEKSALPGARSLSAGSRLRRPVDDAVRGAAHLKACSKFLLKGSLFILPLILLFRSKVNILKIPRMPR